MNLIVKKQLTLIRAEIEKLRLILEAERKETERLEKEQKNLAENQDEEKEELRKEGWRLNKELITLKRISDDFDEVSLENQRFREERKDFRTQLEQVLSYAKALGALHRP